LALAWLELLMSSADYHIFGVMVRTDHDLTKS
jgi:hypothetical protein